MEATIVCVNSDCGMRITVPEGANQLVCPHCNTWQIVTLGPGDSSADIFDDPLDDLLPTPLGDEASPTPPVLSPELQDEAPLAAPLAQEPAQPEVTQTVPQQAPDAVVAFLVTDSGERLGLKAGENSIGRAGTDVLIYDQSVSRTHCFIDVVPNGTGWSFFLADAGNKGGKQSTNGVFLSGRSLRLENHEKVPFRAGARITLGRVSLVLQMATNHPQP